MMYSELSLRRMLKKGVDNLSKDELLKYNIMNYIRMIHLNKDDFVASRYKSRYFDGLKMYFCKEAGAIFGKIYCYWNETDIRVFLFNDFGYDEIFENSFTFDIGIFEE